MNKKSKPQIDLAQAELRQAIVEAGGNEVFCLGRTDADRIVAEVEILARGHAGAVPAILQYCRPGDVIIHNHPSGDLTPSDADLEIASRVGIAVNTVRRLLKAA